MDAKVVYTHRKLTMMGDHVAVCQSTTTQEKTVTIEGVVYTGKFKEVIGSPYIDFVYLREDDNGEVWEDDDHIGKTGMDADTAEQVARELQRAAQCIRNMEG